MNEEQVVESGISLTELFGMLLRNIYLIIILTISITLIGVIYTFVVVEPKYSSSADIMVQVDKTSGSGQTANDIDLTSTLRLVQTVAELMEKDLVLEEVIKNLNLEATPNALRKRLSIKYSSSSLFVTVKYSDYDPLVAEKVVNEIISESIDIANDKFPALNNVMVQAGKAKQGTYASPNKTLNIAISILLGGVIGVVAALAKEFLKTTVRNKKELEALITKYQVIGVIPLIDGEGSGE